MRRWAEAGVADDAALGGFGADPIGTLAATGELPQGADRALADLAGLAVMAAGRYPGVRAVTVDVTPYAEAGASEGIELAAMLSTGAAYLRAMANAGLDADAAGSQLELVLGADPDVFTTVAKLRAARRVWSAMAGACGVDVTVAAPAMSVRTLDRALSRRDPWVNLLRVTAAAFAAAVGGADSVITTPFDAELGEPGELGRRMARNTQLLLGEESGVGRVIDPAGGSWYVETLTEELAEEAWSLFRVLEGAGGLPAVLLDGTLATRIASVRDERLGQVATRRAPITGVSEFPLLDEQSPEVAPRAEAEPVAEPATASATTCTPLGRVRWAEGFEALRDAADRSTAASGRPQVFLANLGPVATHTARASWAKNFFEAGGIEATTSGRGGTEGFASAEAAAEDFAASGARIVCVCSSDERYAEMGAPVIAALVGAGAELVYLAGRPTEGREELEAAGVGQFVHVGVDVLAVLRSAHELLGIEATEVAP
jgi:methylmalonyl-CoA mutase